MKTFSEDAKSIFTAIFGFGVELSFCFQVSRPTARCNAALAELELAAILVRTVERDEGRIVYRVAPGLPDNTLRKLRIPQSKITNIQIAEPAQ